MAKSAAAKAAAARAAAKAAARGWQEAAASKSAPKREHKAENLALSKMVGFLRYQSEVATKVDDSKKDAAKEALEIYRTLSDKSTRLSFLSNFEQAGSGKNADALKFALEFRQTLSSSKQIDVGSNEDFFTRHAANS